VARCDYVGSTYSRRRPLLKTDTSSSGHVEEQLGNLASATTSFEREAPVAAAREHRRLARGIALTDGLVILAACLIANLVRFGWTR
jgi:hypothetical protein